jgi:hypothetical protein
MGGLCERPRPWKGARGASERSPDQPPWPRKPAATLQPSNPAPSLPLQSLRTRPTCPRIAGDHPGIPCPTPDPPGQSGRAYDPQSIPAPSSPASWRLGSGLQKSRQSGKGSNPPLPYCRNAWTLAGQWTKDAPSGWPIFPATHTAATTYDVLALPQSLARNGNYVYSRFFFGCLGWRQRERPGRSGVRSRAD